MNLKPYLCGRNRTNLPTSGCNDCSELEQRIAQIEEWIAEHPSGGGGTVEPMLVSIGTAPHNATCESVSVTDVGFDAISEAYLSGTPVIFFDVDDGYYQVVGINTDVRSAEIMAFVYDPDVGQRPSPVWYIQPSGRDYLQYPLCYE